MTQAFDEPPSPPDPADGSDGSASPGAAFPGTPALVEVVGAHADGAPAHRVTLRNAHGITVRVLDLGGIIASVETPDRDGRFADIVLGHDHLDGYRPNPPYLGALIGRVANRIRNARFTLDGHTYPLAANDGPHTLHGGRVGFDQQRWALRVAADRPQVTLQRDSPGGEEGFPGALSVTVTYTLTPDDRLVLTYEAHASAATPVNLTNHTYWNLRGDAHTPVDAHVLQVAADHVLPTDTTRCPTGAITPVDHTAFDFRAPRVLAGTPYDHPLVLSMAPTAVPRRVATLHDRESGRQVTVATTAPCLQLYTGDLLDGSITGRGGVRYTARAGVCLETQHFPDAPNVPAFPSVIVRPGAPYRARTVYHLALTT